MFTELIRQPRTNETKGMNYLVIKFYHEFFELQQILNGEILPLASQIGLNQNDPALFKAAQNFVREMEKHFDEYDLDLKKINKQLKKGVRNA